MAGTLELDKPSTAPFVIDASDDDARIEETSASGETGAVLRGPDGQLAYPNYIPPEIDSPKSPRKNEQSVDDATRRPKTQSDPLPLDDESSGEARKSSRPSLGDARQVLTDAPQPPGRSISTFPRMRRAGSNPPLLARALSQHQEHAWSSSSSGGETDDDDEDHAASGQGRPPAKDGRGQGNDTYGRFRVTNEHYRTKGEISRRDGRLKISVHDTSQTGYLAKALGPVIGRTVPSTSKAAQDRPRSTRLSSGTTATSDTAHRPKLNIVIMVIGSRGDAQPFLKVGKELQEYGHRVRIATHPAFRDFIEKDSGLEFFSVGGDPSELMAFMVKNPGMIPKLETVKSGDIGKRRAAMAEMFEGFWRACTNATDNEKDTANLKMMGAKAPFVADAIIANPPSFAHYHCAEALGIPLHLMFTFPYTPTQAFPHPLTTIKKTNIDPGYTNFMSYPLVEMMVWQGLGDLVNDFRVKTLGLDPVSTLWAPGATYRLHVPFTYLWSPGLVPKPEDWGPEIDIAGFVFLDLASSFEPPKELADFLGAGDPPIYIGFGSIVVDDADKFTAMIFEAVEKAGVRALVSKGWGGLGQEKVPDNIFMLDNTPHDWLFPQVRACVIHGGAGTTAIALKCGKPTMVVPFFGDQHFWGSMIAGAGAGPKPVPYKKLDVEKLAEGIKFCLTEEALQGAQKIARDIEAEGDGAKNAIHSFHHHLQVDGEKSMRCSILQDRVAVWIVKGTNLKLSAVAADILVEKGYISWKRLRLVRHMEWNDFEGPGEPVTGVAGSLVSTAGGFFGGLGSVPYRMAKLSNKRAERKKRKEQRRKEKLAQKKQAAEPKPLVNQATVKSAGADGNTQSGKSDDAAEFPFPATTEVHDHQPTTAADRPVAQRGATNVTNQSSLLTGTPGPPTGNVAAEYAHELQEGLGQSGRAIARAPVDLSLAIAQGFHNAPRLYGDETVRRPIRVTGIKSGLRAARSEFVYGIYDGVTGVVRLPVKGAREGGFAGAIAGVGMGLGGFVLKDITALVAPVGYTLKGIAKQAGRQRQPNACIRRARIVQAQREMISLSADDRKTLCEEVYKGWDVMRQLGELILSESGSRGIAARLSGADTKGNHNYDKKAKHLGKWGSSKAFESVPVAEKAIAAMKDGEDMQTALGFREKGRRSMDLRKSWDVRRSGGARRSAEDRPSREQNQEEVETEERRENIEAKVQRGAELRAAQAVDDDAQPDGLPPRVLEPVPSQVGPDTGR